MDAPQPGEAERAGEVARLAALAEYDILDTPREEEFEDVAALASEICETPIAVINLIGDGRQFFKAEVGLGVRETPLGTSFCARAILEHDFMLVKDAASDPRFSCSPLVTTENGLRFYAGALLKTASGHPIGTVCVLDYKPRELLPVQEKTLRVLARQVMKQLELRRALRERDQARDVQRILNDELGHRLKNTLAMVQAIASQTLKGVAERGAVDAFESRLLALSHAQDVLLQERWTAAPIRAVVEGVLFSHRDGDRIGVSGPDLVLGPKATLSTSLLLHEMATNAAKYGALSMPEGQVSVSWRIEGDDDPELVLDWAESGGPAVTEPARRGFGTRLIRMGLLGAGGVEKRYLSSGLVAEFRANLSAVQAL